MERKATKRKYRHKVRCLECKKEVDSDFFKAHVSKQHPGKDKSYETVLEPSQTRLSFSKITGPAKQPCVCNSNDLETVCNSGNKTTSCENDENQVSINEEQAEQLGYCEETEESEQVMTNDNELNEDMVSTDTVTL